MMSNTIPTKILLTLYADQDYMYHVSIGEEFELLYEETNGVARRNNKFTFGSLEEMKTVAEAMLKAIKFYG